MKFRIWNGGVPMENAVYAAGLAARGRAFTSGSIWRVGFAWSLALACGAAAAQTEGAGAGHEPSLSAAQAHDGVAPAMVSGTEAVNLNPVNPAVAPMRDALQGHARLADAGTAGAMAMAGMPQAYTPGRSMIAAGTAGYEGQSALAVGLSKISDNGRWVVKLIGSANSRGNVGVSAGAGYQW